MISLLVGGTDQLAAATAEPFKMVGFRGETVVAFLPLLYEHDANQSGQAQAEARSSADPEVRRNTGAWIKICNHIDIDQNYLRGLEPSSKAYAMSLFRATKDEIWLDRARRFGMHACRQSNAARQQHHRSRYSL